METGEFQSLEKYPEAFLSCRAIAHNWVPQGLPWVEQYAEGPIVMERLRCGRCSAIRVDQRTPYGNLLRRRYGYEDGYKLHADLSSEKSAFAKERFHRILGDIEVEKQQAV